MNPFEEITVASSLDGSLEPSLLHLPNKPKALLVALHTWSADRFNQTKMLPFCQERGWALLLPEFRGPNLNSNPRATEAGGSPKARRDIVDATRHVISERLTTPIPAFLLGGSGGGHMALMVAAREDFPWQAVSSWCPITDLAEWHTQNSDYAPHIEAICGGTSLQTEAECEYKERSPLYHITGLHRHRLLVAHGRHDSAVPWSHSWQLATRLIEATRFYFSLFDGGHELRTPEAFTFFERSLHQPNQYQLSR